MKIQVNTRVRDKNGIWYNRKDGNLNTCKGRRLIINVAHKINGKSLKT